MVAEISATRHEYNIRNLWFHNPKGGTYKELVTGGGAENAARFHVTVKP